MMDRDGVSEAAAWKRLEAQSSNAERVRYANVVFSSQWEPEYTQKQVGVVSGSIVLLSKVCYFFFFRY